MTAICWGLNGGDGNLRAAARMDVTLGTPELGEDAILDVTPTPAGTVSMPAVSMARCKRSGEGAGD